MLRDKFIQILVNSHCHNRKFKNKDRHHRQFF